MYDAGISAASQGCDWFSKPKAEYISRKMGALINCLVSLTEKA